MSRSIQPEVESKIEQRACKLIWDNLGIEGSKLKILGDTGYPDRIFWLPHGRPLLIEFKRPGEEPEPKQLHVHRELRGLGYQVEVHDNEIDAFEAVITALESAQLPEESREILARAQRKVGKLRENSRRA